MSSPRDPGAQGAAPGTGHESKADEPASSKERAAVAQTLPAEALMPTLPPEASAASMRSARGPAGKSAAAKQEEVQFAVTLGPDGPIDPHAATLRPGGDIDPYGETLSPSRRSAALADTLAPEDLATGSTLGPESASSLPERSLDGVVSVGDMSRLQSDYPVARWDRYEFQKKLGQGGMGAVYKARDRRLGRDVALKFIRGGDPNMVMRFLQEARAQARIDHPNVCKVYEVGEVEGKAYIAMQYVDGQSLNRAAKGLSLTEKVLLMRQVAEAMHEAHRLGIIHRDLKPDNIMVERLTDGTLSPVVMDFGLARESGDNRGLTESGAVMGTPAYMAPEQARGDVRTLDRRADVYSLGATLYDLVAGVPPFDAESVVDVLMQVMNEDAVPLRNRLPSVPGDLETIVMKCLRKEPGARYDSAKALADDLQRYIDGEPIQGRRESVIGRVRRRAKKHVALVAVSAGSLVLVISFAVQWVRVQITARRERERAAELVKLERQLGQDIKEMEWFLRSAYQLPLHDITPQLAIVRSRMANMESQRAALRGDDGGRIDYAIGRGHLALHEPAEALRYLQTARKRGLDIPELHYALGRALGERFQQALEEARRQGDKSWVEKRRKELEAEYLQPAVQELEKSRGGSLDSPEYLEGLIAFYRKQYDVALEKAKSAFAKYPWLYEIKALEGDALLAKGSELCDSGNYVDGIMALGHAADSYNESINVGRSDVRTYEAQADVFVTKSSALFAQGKNFEPELKEIIAITSKAIAVNSEREKSKIQEAYAYFWVGFMKGFSGQDSRDDLKRSIQSVDFLLKINKNNALAYDMLGNGYYWIGAFEKDHNRDPLELWKKAEEAFEKSLALENRFPWAHNDRGLLYQGMGNYFAQKGGDWQGPLLKSVASFQEAIDNDPAYMSAYVNKLETQYSMVELTNRFGCDPTKFVREADSVYRTAVAVNKNVMQLHYNMANIVIQYAVYLRQVGDSDFSALSRAREYANLVSAIDDNICFADVLKLRIALIEAARLIDDGDMSEKWFGDSLQLAERCRKKPGSAGQCELLQSRLYLLAAGWRSKRGESALPYLNDAVRAALDGRKVSPDDPDGKQVYVSARRAFLLHGKNSSLFTQADLDTALNALETRRNDGTNHANLASYYLLAARSRKLAGADAKFVDKAAEHFQEAIRLNPRLQRTYQEEMQQVESLRAKQGNAK